MPRKRDYLEWMASAGWTYESIGGDPAFSIQLDDRKLESLAQFKQGRTSFTFIDKGKVWIRRRADVRHHIFPTILPENCAVVSRRNSRHRTPGEGSAEFIAQKTRDLMDWAQRLDLDAEIHNHAAPAEQYGLRALDHITALSYLGRTEELQRWAGADRARFEQVMHPLIAPANLARAITLAQSRASPP